jgi:hypothetical protein
MPSKQVAEHHQLSTRFRSLNVDLDRRNPQALSNYVVTTNALRAASRILEAIETGSGAAWTLTGPFGTGKSAFCVFLSHLLAPLHDSLTTDLIRRLRSADSGIAGRFFKSDRTRIGLHTATVSGSNEPLQAAFARALGTSDLLAALGLPQRLARQMADLRRRATIGEAISSRELLEAVERVIDGLEQTRDGPRGVLLVLDELGKLLEYASANPDRSDVFLLQQLGELAARSKGRLFLIGVLHQDFRGYATSLPPADRAEWEKIRGRFEDLVFEEPPSQLLRFVAIAWQRLCELERLEVPRGATKRVHKLAPHLWEHGLAPPGIDMKEGLAVLAAASPLHPLASSLLGPIFRRVGQNERSAFSFLASDDPRALRAFVKSEGQRHSRLYDVVDLYSHLRAGIGNGLLHTPDARRWAEAFEAESRQPTLTPIALHTLQAIALLNIASRWYPLQPSREVLAYALGERCSSSELDLALDELRRVSVIVHRKYNDSYSLWEGSDVDIEARLGEGRDRVAKATAVATLLNQHHRVRPLLARRHGFETGTLRFFGIEFAHADDLDSTSAASTEHDGRIIIVLPSQGRGHALNQASLSRFDTRTLLRVLAPHDRLSGFALELGAIDWVRRNTPELENDATARRELYTRSLDVGRALDILTDQLLTGNGVDGGRWIYKGSGRHIASGRQLNEELSEICDSVFSSAPRIDNEIINRRELSSAAAAARGVLLRRMIESSTLPTLGLDGDPPERSIYRSILSTEGGLRLHRKVDGEWMFRRPPSKSEASKVYAEIERFFDASVTSGDTVAVLFAQLRQPPFGLRDGVIPIFLCSAMLARESDVALYEESAFCPDLNAETFERLIKAPERFTIRQWSVSGVRNRVFEELERVVGAAKKSESGKARILNVVRPLLRFVSSLPPFTRLLSQLSPTTCAIRRAIEEAREPDVLLFADLPRACGLNPFEPAQHGRNDDIHAYRKALKSAFAEMSAAYPSLLRSLVASISDTFGMQEGSEAAIPRLQARAAILAEFAVERDLKMFLDRILVNEPNPERWAEGVAGFVAERPVEKWREEDQPRFLVRLGQFTRRFTLLEATLADRPSGTDPTASIRVSLTGVSFGQLDHAVHLSKRAEEQVARLQRALEGALDQSLDPNVAIAALCGALRQRLGSNSSNEVPSK